MNVALRSAAAGILLVGLAACTESSVTSADRHADVGTPSGAVTSPSPTSVVALPDGHLRPGRYRFVVRGDCEGADGALVECPDGTTDPPPIPLVITVPAGWDRWPGVPVVATSAEPSGREGFLVLGWTSNTVGVQSDACLAESHQPPDLEVGPGVDAFVDMVVSQEWFRGTAPVDTRVGGAPGRYFTLEGPSAAGLGECYEWRPWDPGFFAQGPRNLWEVWVLDVRGHRVVIVAHYFPGTTAATITQLTQMVESIRFGPVEAA
jgi:hypothetical protein